MPADVAHTLQGAAPPGAAGRTEDGILRRATALVYGLAGLLYLIVIARGSITYDGRVYFTLFDDSMISMRYAKTLAAGGGFTWNPGETPIEGITNPLWTLWMALLHFVPVPEGFVALLVALSSAALLLATARATQLLARRLGADEITGLAVLAGVALYYPLAFWSLRGMETGALACLMAWSMVLVLRQTDNPERRNLILLAAMAAALVWVRQDAIVFLIVLFGFVAASGVKRHRDTLIAIGAATLAALLLLTLFRLAYYGAALPNTYYLKVTGVTLGERLGRGLGALFSEEMRGHLVLFAAIIALSVPAFLRSARPLQHAMALPLAAFLAQCAYSVYVGGDVWEMLGHPNRYIAIALPGLIALSLVLLASLARAIAEATRPPSITAAPLASVMFVAMAALLLGQTSARHVGQMLREGPAYAQYDRAATQVGLCLRENTAPEARLAMTWAGSLAYYADRFGIDLLGKMDPVIAQAKPQIEFEPGHNKWDYAWSIDAHRPDYVLQLFRPKPAEVEQIRARGYRNIDRAWPCLANTFLEPDDVFVRPR